MNKIFIDTNIVVYANDKRDKKKQEIALKLISNCIKKGSGVISTQVLQEYAYTAIRKLNQKSDIVLRNLNLLESLEVINQTPEQIRRAVEIMHLYKISFWDACIISNAEFASCKEIYSEDLNTGQFYSGIKVINPFL